MNARDYRLERNVHIVAFGKAAPAMVEGAEEALRGHVVDGIASVPVNSMWGINENFSGENFTKKPEKLTCLKYSHKKKGTL